MPMLSGLDLQRRLSAMGCTLPVIFVTAYEDVPTTVRGIKAGAEDFLIKPVASDQLVAAIERAISRYEVVRAEAERLEAITVRLAALTPRERQVFGLVIQGKTNKQIGNELGATERTIKAHRQKMCGLLPNLLASRRRCEVMDDFQTNYFAKAQDFRL